MHYQLQHFVEKCIQTMVFGFFFIAGMKRRQFDGN